MADFQLFKFKSDVPVGTRFGYWVVTASRRPLDVKVGVRCDCGVEKQVNVYTLLIGRSKSCGCQTDALRLQHPNRPRRRAS